MLNVLFKSRFLSNYYIKILDFFKGLPGLPGRRGPRGSTGEKVWIVSLIFYFLPSNQNLPVVNQIFAIAKLGRFP